LSGLRPYQRRAIDDLYQWFDDNNTGNPCIVMPTGSGKSHIVAALCKEALQEWPEQQILMLTHVKELIEQNAQKMLEHWPEAPLGIYSASIGIKRLDSITFAGIQSVWRKVSLIGYVDLIIIDECHLVSHRDEGTYRKLINALKVINPYLRVIGLTATPYRLGHGLITDDGALFSALIEPVGIEELVIKGFLAPLRSKLTKERLDVSGVKKRGGDFVEHELQAAVNKPQKTAAVVEEVIGLAGDRRAWLFFCSGVDHAFAVRDELRGRGISAETIYGETPKREREEIIADYRAGKIRALTNANVLTTGFDYPDIDLIVMLRPTMSPTLYMQMAGRGMRPKSHTDHCLVLDFAGVVETHGPVTAVNPPKKAGAGNGEAPVKVCSECNELVPISVKECPGCGYQFPAPEEKKFRLRDVDIMGIEGSEFEVTEWKWRKHVSRMSGAEMLSVSYYGGLAATPITEYFAVLHEGYAGTKATTLIMSLAHKAGLKMGDLAGTDLDTAVEILNRGNPPTKIICRRDGKYHRVIRRDWPDANRTRGAAALSAVV
jgi:DNA repair protein RadD